MALSPPAAEAFLYRMEAREKEIGKRAGHDEKGKDRREAVLGGFSGRICGSVVWAKPVDDYLNDI